MELCMILNWYIVVKMSLLKGREFAKQITDDHSDVDGFCDNGFGGCWGFSLFQ
jgi:hypothetical protein